MVGILSKPAAFGKKKHGLPKKKTRASEEFQRSASPGVPLPAAKIEKNPGTPPGLFS